jgi:murein DD-endopeptidase MepM/ murein hydrolase activator NlpD
MDIILVSRKLAQARTIRISVKQAALSSFVAMGAIVGLTTAFNVVLLRHAVDMKLPVVDSLVVPVREEQTARAESNLRENLNTMAVRVGKLQAEVMRLDSLAARLATLAGFRRQDLMGGQAPGHTPGQGGPMSSLPSRDFSMGELTEQIHRLIDHIDERGDKLGLLESLYTREGARKGLVPRTLPVDSGWASSNFGWRIDPFTGQQAFHEGIDFSAESGTPINAAAGGVVVYSEFHPQYGNMVEINHGNDLISRYAHASKRLVKVGDVVVSGAKIAEVGRTGRSTGTHLHFEVRLRGVPQNPTQFLRMPG